MRSEVTFGPTGRIIWTVLLIAPVLFGIFYSVFFFIAGMVWLFIVPLALRDVWRAVRNPDAPPEIVLSPEVGPPKPGESIHERKVPRRW